VLMTSEEQLEEFRRVTRYPRVRRFIEPAAAGTMHNEPRHLAVLLTDLPTVERSPDPADNFLLAMTQAGMRTSWSPQTSTICSLSGLFRKRQS
jgi:uncharacterized protein